MKLCGGANVKFIWLTLDFTEKNAMKCKFLNVWTK